MKKKLKRQFIFFNLIVIGVVIGLITFVIFLGPYSNFTMERTLITLVLCFILVYGTSVLLSNFALKPIEKAWQSQLDFTADASHELRTPLAVIRTNLEIVLDNPAATVESQQKWLHNILIENLRMSKLVEDLLTLTRGDIEHKQLEIKTFNFTALIKSTMESFEAVASQKKIDIFFDLEHDVFFNGDESKLAQLLGILIDNSLKYMNRAGEVRICLKQKANDVILTFSDNGQGIEGHHINKLFDRFYRVEGAHNEVNEGFGLGLPIGKNIVEKHEGTIKLESKYNEGTYVFIILPKRF